MVAETTPDWPLCPELPCSSVSAPSSASPRCGTPQADGLGTAATLSLQLCCSLLSAGLCYVGIC